MPEQAARLSRFALTGLVLIGVGLVEALVGAVASPAIAMPHHGPEPAHLLAFTGMVMVLGGVLRRRSTVDRTTHKEDSNAVR